MDFEEIIKESDERILEAEKKAKKDHQDLIIQEYKPLFLAVAETAVKHMEYVNLNRVQLSEINELGGIEFRRDGKFYNPQKTTGELNLDEIRELYERQTETNQDYENMGGYTAPTALKTMSRALEDFRKSVRKAISDKIANTI